MSSDFYAVIDLEKLADKLTPILADRLGMKVARPAANEPDDWPDESQTADEVDPWSDDPPVRETRSQTRSAGPHRTTGRQPASRDRAAKPARSSRPAGTSLGQIRDFPSNGKHTDKFERPWFFGEDDAPECKHGEPAARVLGVSQSGKDYEVWACPGGFGRDYKNKCDLWDYL